MRFSSFPTDSVWKIGKRANVGYPISNQVFQP